MESRNKKKFSIKNLKKQTIAVLLCITIFLIMIIAVYLKLVVFDNKEGQVSTFSKSSLEKVIEINELSTIDYTYNATTRVYDEEKEELKYYVAYEGMVTAGINFEQIDIQSNETEKKVIVTIPEVEIHDVKVDMGTLDFIFMKDKYETETVSQEAYKACLADLSKRVDAETDLRKMAKENAIESVKALFEPWVIQIDAEYSVEIQ